jgi:rod shape-determining protein MreD
MSPQRIRDWGLTLLFGVFALLLQTTALHALFGNKLEINLLFGMVIWLAFYKNLTDGVFLSLLLSFGQGALSGTLSGVYILAGMSLYLICWLLRDRFAPKRLIGQLVFSLGLAVFYKLVLLLAMEIFVGRRFLGIQTLSYIAIELLVNAFLAPLIFLAFNRIKDFYDLFPDVVEPRRG